MNVYLGKVKAIVNSQQRLIECNLGYSNNNIIARCAFFNVDIKVGDRVIIFVSNMHGFMEAIALPLENKFEQTLDNIRISYEDNYIDLTENDIVTQVAQDDNIHIDSQGISLTKSEEEHTKIAGELILTNEVAELYKSDASGGNVKSYVRLENDGLQIGKGDNADNASSVIDLKDDKLEIKQGQSIISLESNKIESKTQNFVVSGAPKVNAQQSTGGFCQILYCPLTGLPHNTDTILGVPNPATSSSQSSDVEEIRPRVSSRKKSRGSKRL